MKEIIFRTMSVAMPVVAAAIFYFVSGICVVWGFSSGSVAGVCVGVIFGGTFILLGILFSLMAWIVWSDD